MVKKCKICKGNLYVTENQLSRNEMCVHWFITIIYSTYVQKEIYIWTLIKQLLRKYQFFTKWPQISQTHKNHNFKSIIGPLDQLLLPYQFYGSDV